MMDSLKLAFSLYHTGALEDDDHVVLLLVDAFAFLDLGKCFNIAARDRPSAVLDSKGPEERGVGLSVEKAHWSSPPHTVP